MKVFGAPYSIFLPGRHAGGEEAGRCGTSEHVVIWH
ncbi:MAG: hypothetical protein Ct9H300mP14_15470 [Gammaproteobacteria bacterium]|nr:MAG: hypothetical protein Ct9H300mP14_15470 [Gammaproteobacteria bacterium]